MLTVHSAIPAFAGASPYIALLAGRILIVALFIISGASKLLAPQATIKQIRDAGLPFARAGLVLAIFIEIGLSVPLLIGYQIRPVTLILSTYCFVAATAFHNRWSDRGELMAFWADMAIIGGLLTVFAIPV